MPDVPPSIVPSAHSGKQAHVALLCCKQSFWLLLNMLHLGNLMSVYSYMLLGAQGTSRKLGSL